MRFQWHAVERGDTLINPAFNGGDALCQGGGLVARGAAVVLREAVTK